MKILHIVPGLKSGGVAQVVYDLADSQIKEGWDVKILSIHGKGYDDAPKRFLDMGVDVETFIIRSRINIKVIGKLAKEMRKYDVVHVHLFPHQFYCAMAHRLLPRKRRPIMITTEHNTYNNRRKYPVLRGVDRWMYRAYDAIIGISPEATKNLTGWLKDRNLERKISTIYNGVNIKKYRKGKSDNLRAELGIKHDRKIVTMVARMTHPKDPLTLLKAIRNIENVDAVLVGYGPLIEIMRKESEKLGIAYRVHLLGLRNDINEILSGSDIGCLSTEWDGFGLVAVEYMAAGLPVIVTDVPGLREVVGDSDALFPFQDAEALAGKIRKLISDETYYQEKKDYSLRRCNDFDVAYMTASYNNVVGNLLKSSQK